MAVDENLLKRVKSALKGRYGISQKNMFGGVCFLHRGNMLCGVDNKSRVMLRIGPNRYEKVLKMKYAREMDFTGKPMKGMVYVDHEGFKTPADAKKWIDLALQFTRTLPQK